MRLPFHRSRGAIPAIAFVRLLTLLLALAGCALSQDEPSQPAEPPAALEPATPPPNTTAYSLTGIVLNSVTGEPVRRALVQVAGPPLTSAQPLAVLTDSEGRFEFPDLPESDITVAARKPGFFSDQELYPENYQPPIVHLGANTPSTVLKLLPESSISGHVATVSGEPLEDTPVRVFFQRTVDGRKHWELRSQSAADEDGQFHVAGLVPGRYLLAAGPNLGLIRPPTPGTRSAREEGFGPLLFPGVPELESATLISVLPGQQAQADFAVKPEPVFKVSGTVSGAAGLNGSLQFVARSGDALNWSGNFDPQTGKFDSRVAAGSYSLRFRAADPTGLVTAADLPLTVSSDVTGVSLVPGAAFSLPVHVEQRPSASSSQSAPSGATISVQQDEPQSDTGRVNFVPPQLPCPQVRLIPTEAPLEQEALQADVVNNRPASFAVRNLVPGHYSVEIVCNPPWYVQSATSGNTDVLRDELVIAAAHRPDPLEIVVRDDGTMLMGSLRADGEPVRGNVLLIPEEASLAQAKLTMAAPTGEFGFISVAPGDYKLLGFDTVDGLEFRNPDMLAPYLSRAVRVTVQPHEQATATVERISAGK
jgi:Carboxypeptidase regulatory-like domain